MPVLTKDAKVYIVRRLACFDSVDVVRKGLKDDLKLDVPHQQISNYDPKNLGGKKLSDEMVNLFNETREAFRADLDSIPIANKAVRLRMLDRAAQGAEKSGNKALMAQLAEQASKEVGGIYTNKTHVEHAGKVGLVHETNDVDLVAKLAKVSPALAKLAAEQLGVIAPDTGAQGAIAQH